MGTRDHLKNVHFILFVAFHHFLKTIFQVCKVPSLDGKPKLFFFACCQGPKSDRVVLATLGEGLRGSNNMTLSPLGQDVFQGFSSVKGYMTWVDQDGCTYIEVCTLMTLLSVIQWCLGTWVHSDRLCLWNCC